MRQARKRNVLDARVIPRGSVCFSAAKAAGSARVSDSDMAALPLSPLGENDAHHGESRLLLRDLARAPVIAGDKGKYEYQDTVVGHFAVDLAATARRIVADKRSRRATLQELKLRRKSSDFRVKHGPTKFPWFTGTTLFLITVGVVVALVSSFMNYIIALLRAGTFLSCAI